MARITSLQRTVLIAMRTDPLPASELEPEEVAAAARLVRKGLATDYNQEDLATGRVSTVFHITARGRHHLREEQR